MVIYHLSSYILETSAIICKKLKRNRQFDFGGFSESVDKVNTLLDGDAVRSKISDFWTALYPRQYHPCTLENPLFKADFRLICVFSPHLSLKKQKCGLSRTRIMNKVCLQTEASLSTCFSFFVGKNHQLCWWYNKALAMGNLAPAIRPLCKGGWQKSFDF